MATNIKDELLFNNIYSFINHRGMLDGEYSEPEKTKNTYHKSKILVIGAGGLGGEVLKVLAMSGFKDIHVIDLDTIGFINSHTQFLFRLEDVGKNKSDVAAAFINNRVKSTHVTSHVGDITKQTDDFFADFEIIIGALDASRTRSYVNQTIHRLQKDRGLVIPFIDGNTEGFKGKVRLIIPGVTACYDCESKLTAPEPIYPVDTIVCNPRCPEHCVQYSINVFIAKNNRKPDGDNDEDVRAVYLAAKEHADSHHIPGLNETSVLNGIMRTMPAVASTNSVVAASCANEVVKLLLSLPQLNNRFFYAGTEGVFSTILEISPEEDCPTCGRMKLEYTLPRETTIQQLVTILKTDETIKSDKHPQHKYLENPFLRTQDDRTLYNSGIPDTHAVLSRALTDFIESGGSFTGGDRTLLVRFEVKIYFSG